MFEPFAHYLAYGSTDQETLRDLLADYDGLLVPGTVAAVQRQGTGGFVLSISATSDSPPYVIDPRFPLFQARLEKPRPSHEKLAEILGDPGLISAARAPLPGDFPNDRLDSIAKAWVEFNSTYESRHSEKFNKYAERLNREIKQEDAQGPARIFPPYFIVSGPGRDWWNESERLWATASAAASAQATRVLAVANATFLGESLAAIPDEEIAIWASGLDEMKSNSASLLEYGKSIGAANQNGKALFALYGGYFHVLLRRIGLRGISHGIGFGEHRDWEALATSGGPPPRFYLPRAHRYIPQDLAQLLWDGDSEITACVCAECDQVPPGGLSYHALMRHSVRVRQSEIERAGAYSLDELLEMLKADREFLNTRIAKLQLLPAIRTRVRELLLPLDEWVAALEVLNNEFPDA